MRKITTDLDNILSLISSAEDYGFKNDMLFSEFSVMLQGILTENEIEEYCDWYLTDDAKKQGYGLEDYEGVKEKLTEFKDTYID